MSAFKEVSDTFINIMKDKIGHPFMGSFMFTFIGINYDILIDLVVNIQDPFAVTFFKDSLCNEVWSRVSFPIGMMFIFPLLIQNGLNFIYIWCKVYTENKIENMKESENNKNHKESAKNYKLKYEMSLNKVHNIIDKSMLISNTILSNLGKSSGLNETFSVFESDEKLNEGQYVSFQEFQNKIIPFVNSAIFLGKVSVKINDYLYVVKIIHHQQLQKHLGDLIKDLSNGYRDIIVESVGVRFKDGKSEGDIKRIGTIDPMTRNIAFATFGTNHNIYNDNMRNSLRKLFENQN
ncbi:hypothetical protein [Leptospira bandrabouensis]|uniref:Uncharacterized protein n=1 Tax=Leptospira bandrabouensis TaxID=2484903 RepID=A0A6H3NTJ4_9LEPT|nr:hypothetical protein [Leptospira bandrabouensis]TGN09419.1 hypothetical protein EHR07_01430 [Leptospira bandrabouensis]TGN12354.1 hypothetical protein EHR08_13305 [Leptospira bandrabouensis]